MWRWATTTYGYRVHSRWIVFFYFFFIISFIFAFFGWWVSARQNVSGTKIGFPLCSETFWDWSPFVLIIGMRRYRYVGKGSNPLKTHILDRSVFISKRHRVVTEKKKKRVQNNFEIRKPFKNEDAFFFLRENHSDQFWQCLRRKHSATTQISTNHQTSNDNSI